MGLLDSKEKRRTLSALAQASWPLGVVGLSLGIAVSRLAGGEPPVTRALRALTAPLLEPIVTTPETLAERPVAPERFSAPELAPTSRPAAEPELPPSPVVGSLRPLSLAPREPSEGRDPDKPFDARAAAEEREAAIRELGPARR